MKKNYRIAGRGDTRKIAEFLATNGKHPLPVPRLPAQAVWPDKGRGGAE